ncbi:hypothetical protein HOA55_00065 [archaeon]|jgi:DNA/RNA endonuclease YhcR with UshA esterase domain|nr:hypothetical protein [archaeon]MBT3577902.1 hypothetical protein [archaeon]MBT6819734.1 hypothetical protein [archaeon]MBT6956018.1 hypothetical protein [archaeon]MBT7025517.1 hypothetical protein [archaeon]
MNPQKSLFIATIIGILILLAISQFSSQITIQGKIQSIKYGNNKITIKLNNTPEQIIIFENKILPLKSGDQVHIEGKQDTYKNQSQIIVDKIVRN